MPKGLRFWCRVYGPSNPKAAPSLVVVEPAHVRRHIVEAQRAEERGLVLALHTWPQLGLCEHIW